MKGEAIFVAQGPQQLHSTLASNLGHTVKHQCHLLMVHSVVQSHGINLLKFSRYIYNGLHVEVSVINNPYKGALSKEFLLAF